MIRNFLVKKVVRNNNFTLVLTLFVVLFVFQMINKNYLSLGNIRNILNQAFVMGTLSVGIGCLLICGKADLSSGAIGMMGGLIVTFLLNWGVPWPLAVLITLCAGAVMGSLNAFFTNVLNIMPFIATLGVSSVIAGLGQVFTNLQDIPIYNKSFWVLGSKNFFSTLPLPFLITMVLLLAYGIILKRTRFGRQIYMTGGNASAARLAGINPKKISTILYINSGAIATIAGILTASRMQTGSPTAVLSYNLDAITVGVLGGISFTGGTGSMSGVFIGILLFNSFKNGLVIAGLDSYYQPVASGILLIAALILDFYRERSRLKALRAHEKLG
ncbi:MAG: ABC transporter permease [Clostridiales bacterium]|nr:ABC transporter permease [Clostridiales bacterium]